MVGLTVEPTRGIPMHKTDLDFWIGTVLWVHSRGVQDPEYRNRLRRSWRFSAGSGAGVIFCRVF